MSSAVKVAVIGAGNAQFSLGIVKDICVRETLAGSLVAFMDVDGGRVEMLGNIVRSGFITCFAGESEEFGRSGKECKRRHIQRIWRACATPPGGQRPARSRK